MVWWKSAVAFLTFVLLYSFAVYVSSTIRSFFFVKVVLEMMINIGFRSNDGSSAARWFMCCHSSTYYVHKTMATLSMMMPA